MYSILNVKAEGNVPLRFTVNYNRALGALFKNELQNYLELFWSQSHDIYAALKVKQNIKEQ
jgi:hypothetical protein